MSDDVTSPGDLDAQIAAVFDGALDEFIARRDALVKELRAAGRTDDAGEVKRLRKPTRTVWALDAAVLADRDLVERLADAVIAMLGAQDGRGSVREATGELRDAVRDLAAAAARAAADAGHRAERAELVPAVMAVVGDATAFGALRAGQLVEIPTGGELDVLTGTPQLAPVATPVRARQQPSAPAPAVDPTALAEAEDAVARAEATATEASDRLAVAERDLDAAEATADEADARLQQAEADARAARTELRRAQQAARTASQELRTADREAARARSRLDGLT
ncbi:MAG: hypothetical protein ACRD2C_04545 [Acidimicrobiales bacterium]